MKNNKTFLIYISLVASLGGFLFGYDWVVIGGAKPFYEAYMGIGEIKSLQGFVMSSAILGCLLGVMVSGTLSDRYGRKYLMTTAALIFIISAIGTGAVSTVKWFVVYRIIGGIGIGIASNLSPMYIAEISPAKIRGRFVSINQLTIVLGILAAQLTNWLISQPVLADEYFLHTWNVQWGWRWMFWAEIIPATLFFILIFFIPESPRWLAIRGRYAEASKILEKIERKEDVELQINELKANKPVPESFKAQVHLLFEKRITRILFIGILMAAIQQWCGINVIFNYAQEVFAAAGYEVSDILFNIVVTGIINVVFTFVGMYTVDHWGRRKLLLFGFAGLTCIYAVLGYCYFSGITGKMVFILVIAAIACYAMSLAPVIWVVISEIFPTRIRGAAMAVATFSLWTACFLLTYTFPVLNQSLGSCGTFWIYGLICIGGFILVLRKLPETKGKTLEQIEDEFQIIKS